MIFLLFNIGQDRYALEAARVVEVLPRVELKKVPCTPVGIAGVLDYYGSPVPVVDLSAMALGIPAKESMSTRLLVVRYCGATPGTGEHRLGILAEMATETIRLNPEDFVEPGVSAAPDAPYLGPVARLTSSANVAAHSQCRIIQRVEVEKLLSPETRERLWQQVTETA